MIQFCREASVPDLWVIDIRPEADQPFCRLGFDYQHGGIPIPGLAGMFSESITGVLEGLKLVGRHGKPGKINPAFFSGPGRTRELRSGQWCSGYLYRGRSLGLVDARRNLLIPAYLWVLSNRAHAIIQRLHRERETQAIGLYDGRDSSDILSPEPLSAAAVLAAYLNGELQGLRAGFVLHTTD
jgi:hypothetical protein